jgi:hypothetical protein
VIGEITARSDPDKVEKKYDRFRDHYNLVQKLDLNRAFWQLLGVPNKELREFREVTQLEGAL